jgi:hypothetical protein
MSDDVTDGFQTYEDAVQAHLDAKNGQNAVTFALVGLGFGPKTCPIRSGSECSTTSGCLPESAQLVTDLLH